MSLASALASGAPVSLRDRSHRIDLVWVALASVFVLWYLLSAMPADDVIPYVERLDSDRFGWDIGHVWIQPIALLIWRLVRGWLDVWDFLEAINVTCTAAGLTIFFHTLRCLGVSRLRGLLALVLTLVSFNMLSLAPTGHIKFMVIPALALATHYSLLWEARVLAGDAGGARAQSIRAGLWFGVAANILVSILPMAPFVGLALLWRQRSSGWGPALRRCLPFALATLASGLGLLLLAWVTALATQTSEAGFIGFVLGGLGEKVSQHPGFYGWKEIPARMFFSVLYNFVFMPDLGGLGRAMLWGVLEDPAAHAGKLLRDMALGGLTALMLGWLLFAALRALRKAEGFAVPLACMAGAACFAGYQNVNDPEHWFQFTLPFVALAALLPGKRLSLAVFGLWLPLLMVVNLGLYGLPKAHFDFAGRQAALQQALGPQGLWVGFAEYPGEPDTSLFGLGGIERLTVDQTHFRTRDAQQTLATLSARIDAALARGGRVLVFRVLDEGDWRGPVMALQGNGYSKSGLARALAQRYEIGPTIEVAGFPAREIRARKP